MLKSESSLLRDVLLIFLVMALLLVSKYFLFAPQTGQKLEVLTIADVNYPLLKPPTEWVDKFGDDVDSQLAFNLFFIRERILPSHKEKIMEIDQRTKVTDPNGS